MSTARILSCYRIVYWLVFCFTYLEWYLEWLMHVTCSQSQALKSKASTLKRSRQRCSRKQTVCPYFYLCGTEVETYDLFIFKCGWANCTSSSIYGAIPDMI